MYRNDCVVRALVEVTGLEYWLVKEVLRLEGRRNDNTGFNVHGWLKKYKGEVLGFSFIKTDLRPEGKFFCYNKGHAWAVVNGILCDQVPGGRRHLECYLVIRNPDGDDTEPLMAKARQRARIYMED